MSEKDYETCTSLAKQLGEGFTPMRVGKIKKAVCDEDDVDGARIHPTGVLKIMSALRKEMDIVETASPDVVTVRVLHHQTGNKHYLFAQDMETKRKVQVLIPSRQKEVLNTVNKRLKVSRGIADGKYKYRYPANR